MQPQRTEHMFNLTFEKSSEEIVKAAKDKVKSIRAKMREREERISKVRKEYEISDAALTQLLMKARGANISADNISYQISKSGREGMTDDDNITIGAGVVNFLLTENNFIESESRQASRLDILIRNLKDTVDENGKTRGHHLSYEELSYLGF